MRSLGVCAVVPGLPTLLIAGDVLEGLKYIIVQRETSGDSGDTVCAALHFTLRHADKVATKKKGKKKKSQQDTWISTFYSIFTALQNLKILLEVRQLCRVISSTAMKQ